jgi:hypothetical protein
MKYVLLVLALFVTSCESPEIKPDPNPQPSSPQVNQARLEFAGCGRLSEVGTIGCRADQQVRVITEMEGTVSYFSTGAGCSLRKDVAAVVPETYIPVPKADSTTTTCAVTVLYLPKFPNKPSGVPVRSLFGEVVFFYDNAYPYKGNLAQSLAEVVRINFPNSVRGAFASRQTEGPVEYKGSQLRFEPDDTGTDLILVRTWDSQSKSTNHAYTANYYASNARALTYTIKDQGGKWLVTFENTVSVITLEGKAFFEQAISIDKKYEGIVRAYTAQGRTRLLRFKGGKLLWTK